VTRALYASTAVVTAAARKAFTTHSPKAWDDDGRRVGADDHDTGILVEGGAGDRIRFDDLERAVTIADHRAVAAAAIAAGAEVGAGRASVED